MSRAGIDLYNDWKDYVEEWVGKAESYSSETYSAVDTAFVTDGGGFHWFFLQVRICEACLGRTGETLRAHAWAKKLTDMRRALRQPLSISFSHGPQFWSVLPPVWPTRGA